jgi:hypothetical protein
MDYSSITINSTNTRTTLCTLGAQYGTDKTVYHTVPHLHRHPYTAVYDMLFNARFPTVYTLGEIGILDNASIQMWREYLPYASIYGFEYSAERIQNALSMNLRNTTYMPLDVKSNYSIAQTVTELQKKAVLFDVLIDDSTHLFEDQVRVAVAMQDLLLSGGMFVIEDVYLKTNEREYIEALQNHYASALFITCTHELEHSPGWNNSKLLILYKGYNCFYLS